MLKADMHVHSNFSNDGMSAMSTICERAVALGVDIICFTDHIDFKPEVVERNGKFNLKKYFDEIDRVRDKFSKNLKVLCGIEISEPHDCQREVEQLNKMPFDFILGSVHYFWYKMNPEKRLDRSMMRTARAWDVYWEEEIKLSKCEGIDSIAHIDYPKRYISERKIDFDALREIFQNTILKNRAIEINTSFIRKGGMEPLPSAEILAFYESVGGNRVTIGSDAHWVGELYSDVEYAQKFMPKSLTPGYFENRKFVPL